MLLNPLFHLKQFANEMTLDDLTVDEQGVRELNSWGEREATELAVKSHSISNNLCLQKKTNNLVLEHQRGKQR